MTESAEAGRLRFRPTAFGLMLEYPLPAGCDCVVVCVDRPTGLQPVQVRLTHQVYREGMQRLLAQHPNATGITLIPYRSDDQISVPLSVIGTAGQEVTG